MTLRVAMIGHGFMGAAHSVGWRQAPRVFDLPEAVDMSVLVGRNPDAVATAAAQWGWAATATDWRDVIERDDVDVVDVVTPGDSHAEIAIAALDAGKHVLVEKPLANTVDEALAMTERASGLRLVLEGATNELASEGRPAMDRARYGDRWSPVLVAWTTPERISRLAGEVAGLGGSQSLKASSGRLINVSGIVYLDAPTFQEVMQRPGGRKKAVAIVAHELGHVVGLGHVDSTGELMGARNSGQTTFGDGDRRGFARLADRPCQLEY